MTCCQMLKIRQRILERMIHVEVEDQVQVEVQDQVE